MPPDCCGPTSPLESHCEVIARLPLRAQPGEAWEYGHSTEVLGRVLEIIEGKTLGALLKERIFDPLGMVDTAFYTPPEKLPRRAEAFSMQTFKTLGIDFMDATSPPAFEAGGGGLLSTLPDYARFCALLLGEGRWNGVELLSPRLFRFMVQNHLPRDCSRSHFLLSPGYGFGLGFAVREDEGVASAPGTVGEFNWGGAAGTAFWVAPADEHVRHSDAADRRLQRHNPAAVPQSGLRGAALTAAHQTPVFGIDVQGSLGARPWPFWINSMETLSGVRMKAMWPSRGGRLMVTPAFCNFSQKA